MTSKRDLTKEIASARRDITIPVFSGLLRPQDDTLISRGGARGYKVYDEVVRDCHAYAVVQKRKMAVVAREWRVDPASEDARDKRAAEVVREQLAAIPFDRICLDLLDALLKGFAVGEVMWEPRDGQMVVADILARDQRRFVFDAEGRLRLLTWESMVHGEPVPERKFIVHRFQASRSNPYGLGLGNKIFWPVWFKREGIKFWLVFLEKFGSPTVVGKHAQGANEQAIDKLLEVIQQVSQETGIVVPDTTTVELLEASRQGGSDAYERMVRWCDEQMSEAVLGETLSTNIGQVGSRAASETHNDVRGELTDADCDLLSDTLNETLCRWITELNVPGATPPTIWREAPEDEDALIGRRQKQAETDRAYYDMGYRISDEVLDAEFGGRYVPDSRPRVAAPGSAPTTFAEGDDRDAVDDLAEQLDTAAAPAMDDWINEIRRIIETSASIPQAIERLEQLYPELSPDGLAGVIGDALAVADLTGRAEVIDA